ncbi:transferase hexapeptide (six repeat-containing protein) [Alkalibacterium subtropicum]|uniref:Transferase hexapeptide (Six repeat-containing protein) n=1 Tax=Alkalibacterium subtropicum TaxID=753702 RepID=A0A1I1GNF7_9LACT|nr:acyltransferase [Alkalibacterium subtropicum]SFC10650.1 transferase hexapeptide (six repeat-containing protein) [Alkalibacterium subtropicum]
MNSRNILQKAYNFLVYILLMQLILGVLNLLPNFKLSNQIRGFLIKPFFKECGKNFQIAKGAIINLPRNIQIGDNVYIAHDAWINGTGGLIIGDGVIISPKVVIATTKHKYVNGAVSLVASENGPINIGNGSWISSNSTLTMNINIGAGCIIGANSAVTKDIPENSFAGGVPAKIIKPLNN